MIKKSNGTTLNNAKQKLKKRSPGKMRTRARSPQTSPTVTKTKVKKKSPVKKTVQKRHKVNVFLDLDQTIISAEQLVRDEDDDEDEEYYDIEKNKKKARLFNYKNMDGYYIIFERPGLQKFLDYLFSNFNVSVWTAGSQDYCLFIVEHIILKNRPERKLDHVLFSYHGKKQLKVKKGTKNLSIIWDLYKLPGYNKNNTIIIDDYDEVWKTNKNNCILAKPFYFNEYNSENDDFLEKLIPKLETMKKQMLKGEKNIVKRINDDGGLISY